MKTDIEEFNEKIKEEYEKTKNPKALEKYIMSETLAPIEDYENVAKLVYENYENLPDNKLLFVGAHSSSFWCPDKINYPLSILTKKYESLTKNEKALTSFLKAYHIRMSDRNNYQKNAEYKRELLVSLEYDGKFVNNRLFLAELDKKLDDKSVCEDILSNISEIVTVDDINKLTMEDFLNPQYFIDEFILGIKKTEGDIIFSKLKGLKKIG